MLNPKRQHHLCRKRTAWPWEAPVPRNRIWMNMTTCTTRMDGQPVTHLLCYLRSTRMDFHKMHCWQLAAKLGGPWFIQSIHSDHRWLVIAVACIPSVTATKSIRQSPKGDFLLIRSWFRFAGDEQCVNNTLHKSEAFESTWWFPWLVRKVPGLSGSQAFTYRQDSDELIQTGYIVNIEYGETYLINKIWQSNAIWFLINALTEELNNCSK